MKKTARKPKPITAEAIARMADRGEDISRFFGPGKMMKPIQRVNVDFTAEMLQELDYEAAKLNISRQAVIKTFVREGLDRYQLRANLRQKLGQRDQRKQGGVRSAAR